VHAIEVDHVSRIYQKYSARHRFQTFKSALVKGDLFRALRPDELVTALDDVTLSVDKGQTYGVIGENGSGKSTLLKLVAGIAKPTQGEVRTQGKISALIELGAGFHPEITGRENIFINGIMLGLTKKEVQKRFDEIVEFAELQDFIDAPVKTYSSGMYVRLGFAVAINVDPDVLLVDEVLAVGDAAFQKRCLGKMSSVASQGRTVLFVSHNMAAVEGLCSRALLLTAGTLAEDGPPRTVIRAYLQGGVAPHTAVTPLSDHQGRRPGSETVLREVTLLCDGTESNTVPMGGELTVVARFARAEDIPNMRFGIAIEDLTGQRLMNFSPSNQAPDLLPVRTRGGEIRCRIPRLPLLPGLYAITLILGRGGADLDRIDRAVEFSVEPADVFGTGLAPEVGHGFFYQEAAWDFTSG
jgi:ABC-2 type transport system ATP-binding protein/lipopolysaccharide transport system ATP-binding protein